MISSWIALSVVCWSGKGLSFTEIYCFSLVCVNIHSSLIFVDLIILLPQCALQIVPSQISTSNRGLQHKIIYRKIKFLFKVYNNVSIIATVPGLKVLCTHDIQRHVHRGSIYKAEIILWAENDSRRNIQAPVKKVRTGPATVWGTELWRAACWPGIVCTGQDSPEKCRAHVAQGSHCSSDTSAVAHPVDSHCPSTLSTKWQQHAGAGSCSWNTRPTGWAARTQDSAVWWSTVRSCLSSQLLLRPPLLMSTTPSGSAATPGTS